MPEVKRKVQAFQAEYICDSCKDGKMVFNGSVLASYPAQYQHECDNCGAIRNFRKEPYPKIVYEEIE